MGTKTKTPRAQIRQRPPPLPHWITVRLSDADHAKLAGMSERLNLSPSDIVRLSMGVMLRFDKSLTDLVLAQERSS